MRDESCNYGGLALSRGKLKPMFWMYSLTYMPVLFDLQITRKELEAKLLGMVLLFLIGRGGRGELIGGNGG